MDEATLRRVVGEVVREEVASVREEVASVREEVASVREEIKASEARIAEGGRLQFRQTADLYRGLGEKIEHFEKHLGERLDATRGAIEALSSSIERQDFRSNVLGRRLTEIELKLHGPESG